MDPKLALMFLLIGAVIGLSYLGNETPDGMRRLLIGRRWRDFLRARRKF